MALETWSGRDTSANIVEEIINCPLKSYYKILGVQESASKEEIKTAYKKLALQVHPDKLDSPNARTAFTKISQAYEVLCHDEMRQDFDIKKDEFEPPSERTFEAYREAYDKDMNRDMFHSSAWGEEEDESEPDPMMVEDEEESVVAPKHKPDEKIKEIYREATPCIKRLQKEPGNDEIVRELDKFNWQIFHHIQINHDSLARENHIKKPDWEDPHLTSEAKRVRKVSFFQDIHTLLCIDIQNLQANLLGLTKATSRDVYDGVRSTVNKLIEARDYPRDWIITEDFIPHSNTASALNTAQAPNSSQMQSSATTDLPTALNTASGSNTSNTASGYNRNTTSGSNGSQQSSATTGNRGQADSSYTTISADVWRPGLTWDNKRILAFRKVGIGYQFLVQDGTADNPTYTLRSGEECGRKSAKVYREMPGKLELGQDDKRFSREFCKEQCDKFKTVLGVAAKPIERITVGGRTPLPVTYVLAQFEEEQVWLTRTTLRKVLGKPHADGEIQKWYQSRKIIPPADLTPPRTVYASASSGALTQVHPYYLSSKGSVGPDASAQRPSPTSNNMGPQGGQGGLFIEDEAHLDAAQAAAEDAMLEAKMEAKLDKIKEDTSKEIKDIHTLLIQLMQRLPAHQSN